MDNMDAHRRDSSADSSSGNSIPEVLPPLDGPSYASKGMFLIALGVAALGLVMGGAGVYMAMGAKSELASYKKLMAAKPDPVVTIKTELDSINDRLGKVGGEVVRANNGLRETNNTLQRSVQSLSGEIRADREQLNKITATLADMSKSGSSVVKKTAASETSKDSPAVAEATTNAAGQRIHVIQSGDFFSKLAKQYGVSTQAIIDANPNVDPNKLQIGQKIVIPESK